jgi:hypothetical protein
MFGSCLRRHELQLGVRPAVRCGSNDSCDGKRSVIALQRSEWIVVGSPFDSGVAALSRCSEQRNGERHYCMQRRLATGKARTALDLARGKAREGPFIVRHIQIPGQGARVLTWLLHLNVLPVSSRPACEH